jgi:hypothetical protein
MLSREEERDMANNKSSFRPGSGLSSAGRRPDGDLGQSLLAILGIGIAGSIALVGGAVKLGEKMLDLQVKAYEKIEAERESHRRLVEEATANDMEFGVDPDAPEE